eukprot:g2305.t1
MRSLVFLSLFVSAVHQVIGQNVESESSLRRRPIRHSLPPPIEAPVIFPGTFKSKASPTTLSSKSGSDKFLTIPSELPKDHLLWPRPETQPEPSSVPQQLASSEATQLTGTPGAMGADPLMQDPLFASMVGSMMGSGSESGFNSNNNIGTGSMMPGMMERPDIAPSNIPTPSPMMGSTPRIDVSSPMASYGYHTPETMKYFYNMSVMSGGGNASSQNLGMYPNMMGYPMMPSGYPMMPSGYPMSPMMNSPMMSMMSNPMMSNPMMSNPMMSNPMMNVGTGQSSNGGGGLAPLTLANGMTINVPKEYAKTMKFRNQETKVVDSNHKKQKNKDDLRDQMRFRASRSSLRAQTGAGRRAKMSSQASAKMSAIMQHQTRLQQELAGAEAATGNVQSMMANMQSSLLQQQQQMMMMQQQALQQRQHVEMLQRKMVALDLVRQRVSASAELDRLMKQYEYLKMFDGALDMRKLAQSSLEETVIRKASDANEFIKETTSRIEQVMNPFATPNNVTKPSVPPETRTLELLNKASSLEQQAQKAEQDAHTAFYDLLSGKPSTGAKPKAGGEAGGEAAKKI